MFSVEIKTSSPLLELYATFWDIANELYFIYKVQYSPVIFCCLHGMG